MAVRIETTDYAMARPAIDSIRIQVFIEEQGIPAELEWDDQDASASFVLAYDTNNQVIGTGRLLADGRIGRMAVSKPWRGQGVGIALLDRLLEMAKQQGLRQVYLSAQTSATGFYQKAGFCSVGTIYQEAGIPHQKMHRLLE